MTDQTLDLDSMTDLDWALRDAVRDVEYTRGRLVYVMRRLAEDMAREADRLDADPDRTVNSLGVVQGRGLDVDRLCAVLDEQRKTAVTLERMLAAEHDVETASADDVEDSPHWMGTVAGCPRCADVRHDHETL
jgi:hypothetical protein